jgi:hypothetical protein
VFRIALPPLRLALRERYLRIRRQDPIALRVAVEELATVERIRARLARQGWELMEPSKMGPQYAVFSRDPDETPESLETTFRKLFEERGRNPAWWRAHAHALRVAANAMWAGPLDHHWVAMMLDGLAI